MLELLYNIHHKSPPTEHLRWISDIYHQELWDISRIEITLELKGSFYAPFEEYVRLVALRLAHNPYPNQVYFRIDLILRYTPRPRTGAMEEYRLCRTSSNDPSNFTKRVIYSPDDPGIVELGENWWQSDGSRSEDSDEGWFPRGGSISEDSDEERPQSSSGSIEDSDEEWYSAGED